jgi:hypothetical protein
MSRPLVAWSRVEMRLARWMGWRIGNSRTEVPSVTRSVIELRAERTMVASKMPFVPKGTARPGGARKWSATQIESKPRRSASRVRVRKWSKETTG